MSEDPFAELGVDDTADDEMIKRHYLALVRAYPPDRDPERFQALRRAYDAVKSPRERMAHRMLRTSDAPLIRLKLHCLSAPDSERHRPSQTTVTALLLDSLRQAGH